MFCLIEVSEDETELADDEELIKAEQILKAAQGVDLNLKAWRRYQEIICTHTEIYLIAWLVRRVILVFSGYFCSEDRPWFFSRSLKLLFRIRAARIPFQASRSTLSSWSPRLVCDEPWDQAVAVTWTKQWLRVGLWVWRLYHILLCIIISCSKKWTFALVGPT